MKLALLLFTEVPCERYACSVEIWFLLNPWKIDQVFARPSGHNEMFILATQEKAVNHATIHMILADLIIRLLHVERILTRASWHALLSRFANFRGWLSPFCYTSDIQRVSQLLLFLWEQNGTALVQEAQSSPLPRGSRLSLCITNLHLSYFLPGWSYIETNVCVEHLALNIERIWLWPRALCKEIHTLNSLDPG